MQGKFDLTYVTTDSVDEGVGASQILPLLKRISQAGLRINLISFEKTNPSEELKTLFSETNINWSPRDFRGFGTVPGITRFLRIVNSIPESRVIHARSDIPAVASIFSRQGPILWDVRSLWADQRAFIESAPLKKRMIGSLRALESISSYGASAMSTLTSSIVPVLEERHKRLPVLRTVVPTAVDLERYRLNPKFPLAVKGLYSGTYNDYYDLDLSSEFIQQLRKSVSLEVHWARPRESNRSVLASGEDDSFEVTPGEMNDLIPSYSFGISICKLDAGPSLKAAMPTKAAEFLACGRPIVINAGLGDLDRFVQEFNAGVVLDGTAGDVRRKVDQLLNLLADRDTPHRCRALAEKYFDIESGVEKYLDIYKKM